MATAKQTTPPQLPPLFNYTPESILSAVDDYVARSKAIIDKVVAETAIEDATFENTLKPVLEEDDSLAQLEGVLCFFHNVHADAGLRDASVKAEAKLSELGVELNMREDIFLRVDTVYRNRATANLDAESLHILEKEHKKYINKGLRLPSETRARFKEIQLELSNLGIEAKNNQNSETGGMWFTPEELRGIPQDNIDINELEKGSGENEGKLKIGFKPTHDIPLNDWAERAETRRDYYIAKANKVAVNKPLFKKIIVLRDEAARLVGYKNHADLRISEKMAKSSDKVKAFLADIQTRAKTGLPKEVAAILKHKEADYKERGLEFDGELYIWDLQYYKRIQKEKEYSVDENAIAEYFALWPTFNAMLDIFRNLFGLRFEELDEEKRASLSPTGNGSDIIWNEEVLVYAVWNDDTGEFVGYLYLDMHPRDHKYSHYANFGIGPSFISRDGSRVYPFTALVCNFTRPSKDKPALLKHYEVVTLFHELGHGIHNLVGRTQHTYTHGTAVSRDFVEAPSQMLEHWCWLPSVLKSLSSHWNTKEQISDDLIDKLISTKRVNSCNFALTQLFYGTFDLTVHGPPSHEAVEAMDVARIWNELRVEVTGIKGPEAIGYGSDWGEGYTSIGHYISGYDAGYYGYLWSEVFSADMFVSQFKPDPFNAQVGRRYCKLVLSRGGSMDEMEMLKEFLGREPTADAFFEDMGLA